MNNNVCIAMAFFLYLCGFVHARPANTGHFVLTLTDRETGGPITNATVTVRCQTEFNLGRTLESHFTKTSAQTDSNGVADVAFLFYDSDFDWRVDAPLHYCGWFGDGYGREQFGRSVVESDYADINTSTVEGLSMYEELLQLSANNDFLGLASKFEPKNVMYTNNVVCRSVCLTPKHHPQPMYGYGSRTDVYLPVKNPTLTVTNGIEVSHYKPVDFDMKECLPVPRRQNYNAYLDGPAGKIPDFHIERFCVLTNGVKTFYGWLEFASGSGAYITNRQSDGHFPIIYEANTNAAFMSRIPFAYSYTNGCLVYAEHILGTNECMVLRTRAATNDNGVVTNCNYSKITGPMSVFRTISFHNMVFNPIPNDPNLEFDVDRNLSIRGDKGCEP